MVTAARRRAPRLSPSHRVLAVGVALGAITLACRDQPPTPSGSPLSAFGSTVASPDCAPWDGPAVSIVLTASPDTAESPTPPFVRVMVYDTAERLLGHAIAWPGDAEVGSAVWCDSDGDCTIADSGVVLLERFAGDTTLVGRLRLAFVPQGLLNGAFHAAWRSRTPLCG